MPRHDFTKLNEIFIKTSMSVGASGSGKTWYLGTMPYPAIVNNPLEGGSETIKYMNPSDYYDPKFTPVIYNVSSVAEMVNDLQREILPAAKRGEIKTIGIELSFFSDAIIRNLKEASSSNGWVAYQALEEHILWVDAQVKKIPGLRLHYTALVSDSGDGAPSSIVCAGKAVGRKLPAMLDCVSYLRAETMNGKTERFLHLTPYGSFMARHRYGDRLPPFVRNPIFRKLEGLLKGTHQCDQDGNVTEKQRGTLLNLPPLKARQ